MFSWWLLSVTLYIHCLSCYQSKSTPFISFDVSLYPQNCLPQILTEPLLRRRTITYFARFLRSVSVCVTSYHRKNTQWVPNTNSLKISPAASGVCKDYNRHILNLHKQPEPTRWITQWSGKNTGREDVIYSLFPTDFPLQFVVSLLLSSSSSPPNIHICRFTYESDYIVLQLKPIFR